MGLIKAAVNQSLRLFSGDCNKPQNVMKLTQTGFLIALGVVLMSVPTLAQNTTPAGSSVPEQRAQDADLQRVRSSNKADKAAERKANKEARKARKQEMKMNRTNGASSSQNTMDSTNGRLNTSYSGTAPATGNNNNGGAAINTSNGTGYTSSQATATQTGAGATSGMAGSSAQTGSPSVNMGSGSTSGMEGTATGNMSTTMGNMNTPAATGTGQAVNNAKTTAPITTYSPNVARTISIGDFTASQPDYSTLQNGLQSAGLVETLQGSGKSYTVFAPSNVAFKKLPAKTQNTLLEGRNKESLKSLLTYHVVDGALDGEALRQQINSGQGKATLTTLAGNKLMVDVAPDGRFRLTDEQGGVGYVDMPDQFATNGVVHGVDKVLLPKGIVVMFK